MEQMDLQNKVLNKAFKKILDMGKHYTTEEGMKELPNSYESALKVARIHTVVQIRELINTIQELEGIANVGILESMCDEQLKDKYEERINIHSNIIDINNDIANVFSQLVEDILGQEELNNISVQVQLDNII